MNIMIVGVCDVEYSTNKFMAQAFKNLGHDVICYNYRTRLKTYSGNQSLLEEDFISTVKAIKKNKEIDLIIFCKTDSLSLSAMNRATNLAETFYWFMDPITTATAIHADLRASACTHASATCNEVIDYFIKAGQPRTYKINEGVDLDLFKYILLEKKTSVLFVGSPTQERHMYIDFLVNSGINVSVFGDGWHGKFGATHPIYNAALVTEINQSKIVLNVSRTDSYSDRVTQSLAAGAFVMTTDNNEIRSDYENTKHLVTYTTPHDLYDKVVFYLRDNKTRMEIAECGMKYARDNYSWNKVCSKILEVSNA